MTRSSGYLHMGDTTDVGSKVYSYKLTGCMILIMQLMSTFFR